ELLAELGAGLPAWWLAPALVGAPALGAAQDVSPTPHVVLRLPARVPAPAEALRLAADDAEPDGSGGRVVARLAGVTVRFDEAARTLVLTAGLGVELRLDDPEVVAVLDLRTGAAAPLAITVRKPTLWIARLPGEGRFELRVGAAVMRLDTVEA
ncbi:MAG: hypothetical protein KC613_23320, partial [Myxococcales bacterium]|nr:hypothetical protein [Myxococcales bacterium]